jgi:DNA-directed RNA polymerase subunit RPC12/RpoP
MNLIGGLRFPKRLEGDMKYSKVGFAEVDSCSKTLFDLIHPEGLPCPRCNEPNGLRMFRRHVNSWIVDYRCSHCRRIFNPWREGRSWVSHTHFAQAVPSRPLPSAGARRRLKTAHLPDIHLASTVRS